ncbi:UDP-3-O-(3-hydroxymyristoyl)glucosamine N-acyltransferase [Capnocytophaga sp. oral taxon 332]|jgi:UDP-3-O-(3-hydroxymyristoyl) glucosamine N-acyltransferase|uniref:UDP-3-O-(3-hydroxymyristoyl)glucosamine N-acyltransferase n=1 Tax=Capnocytophaga sp. oral taxon 332 TaxID=712213 RepID=UPI0002A3DC71|nr:UDP-3-O-(3-hydroxymyristoyl)glucosamine N-acyltransferase [Capnocytophaga sp. oral taxon 332]EKY10657.1 UDP-3-O-[3-hydroxymyristoyl] glucosamine N-acyltransferase [Capnocytophaga sp. oral taxon 332 str. F0381]
MRFSQPYTLKQIATIIGAKYVGDENFPVFGMNEIHVVQMGDIVFVDHPKYYDKALESRATVILINKEVECPKGKALLISDDPFRDFNKLTQYFKPFERATATIAPTATIGEHTIIQPGVFIGNHVTIGKHCVIHPNVSIYDHCEIGDFVTIHAGTVLGADAFYYKKRANGYDKLKSGGRVVIEDNVDLGALCTIDRGVTADTTIKKGTKIDNHVHIGHDTVVGERCLIASQTGIAGCVVIEDDVTIWGQVGMTSGITIGKKAVILAQSGVSKSLEGGHTYFGYPAGEAREKYKEMTALKQLISAEKKSD